jgi:hypothetical protein
VASQSERLRAARKARAAGDLVEMKRLVSESVAALVAAETDDARAEYAHLLASFYRDIGDLSECEKHARDAVRFVRRSGSTILLGNHLMFLALVLRDTNRVGEAVSHVEEALSCYVDVYGQAHGEVRYITSVLANMRKQVASRQPGS